MSLLTDFAKGASQTAFKVIGEENITINGGAAIAAVLNETESSGDYQEGGYPSDSALTAVVSIDDWNTNYPNDPQTYLRKLGTARSQTLKVDSIRKGASFVEITFIDEEGA